MIALIVSKKDIAGLNIKQQLLRLFGFKELNEKFDNNLIYEYEQIRLYTINEDTIHSNNLDRKINAELFIFASRHKSESQKPCFCIHTPGNWDKAEHGGYEKQLCIASPNILKKAFQILNEIGKNLDYEITLEATHHGPYLEKPCFFIEIGSTEKEWNDKKAAEIIGKTIMQSLNQEKINNKIALGIGGQHYSDNFNKLLLRTDIAIGHICPKYQLESLDENMIKQSIEKTNEKVDFVLLDWKGLGKEKQRIIGLLDKMNIKYQKVDSLL